MKMPSDRWQRTEALFHAARTRSPAERVAFLAEACGDDEAMRRDLESLLVDAASDDAFLAQPVSVNPELLSAAAASVVIGRVLGTYRVDALLGVGGMGAVYRAYDTKLNRVVALKDVGGSSGGVHPTRLFPRGTERRRVRVPRAQPLVTYCLEQILGPHASRPGASCLDAVGALRQD